MRRAYLMVYSDALGTRDQVKACLDALPEIITWRYDLPHSFYLISEEESATTLADLITMKMGKGRFIISEIGSNKQGWLPDKTWYFINKKMPKPPDDTRQDFTG